jgi:hypothetical protein
MTSDMKNLKQHTLENALTFHRENGIPLYENVFRPHSEMDYNFISYVKGLYKSGELETVDEHEEDFLNSDVGQIEFYENEMVPLDYPFIKEEVELNKPKRGGNKKFYVYVKNDKGNVVKVEFGDTSGLKAKIGYPEARKNFAARHDCKNKNDKTTPGYWSCRLPMFGRAVGLKTQGNFFW